MIRIVSILTLLAGLAHAQIVAIAAGSPTAITPYTADQFFSGGTARPFDGTIGQGIYATTRFGTDFSYHIPVPVGFYGVNLRLSDPTSTAAGQRVFTVSVNGALSAPIDIFALVGARTPYSPPTMMALAGTGFIDLVFHSTAGNATVSGIDIRPLVVMIEASNTIGVVQCPIGWSFGRQKDGKCLALFLANALVDSGL